VVGELDEDAAAMTGRWVRQTGSRLVIVGAIALVVSAHVGSPDTYFEGAAGPYPVRVIVRSPGVVPGLAQITVRLLSLQGVPRRVLVLPLYWDPRTAVPPPADVAERVPGDSTLYSAALWLMTGGSYSVQVTVEGSAGSGTALVPVMAVATRRLVLDTPLAAALLALGLLLCVGAVTLIGAAVRESGLAPGAVPDRRRTLHSRVAMGVASVVLALALLGGRAWWNGVDAAYRTALFQPLHATASVRTAAGARVLRLAIDDTSWANPKRQWTPLVPDHGHLMHLFLVRDSTLDAFAHLHPLPLDSIMFETDLPPLPPGRYRAYADIVHESGFAQTLVSTVDVPSAAGAWRPSDADDAWIEGVAGSSVVSKLADGSTMSWQRESAPIVVDQDAPLRFVVTEAGGQPATLDPYMGMPGHLMLARDDGAVFVHLHPAGTISLAALETFTLRQPGDTIRGRLAMRLAATEKASAQRGAVPDRAMPMSGLDREPLPASGSLSFPYAFPKSGHYHIWVQVKRSGRILTGAFAADVQPAR
jgi:hypothetical protein